MAKAESTKKKENLRRSKRNPKKPHLQVHQDCVLFSTSKAKSRERKKMREKWAERQRKGRQKKKEIESDINSDSSGKNKTTKKKK